MYPEIIGLGKVSFGVNPNLVFAHNLRKLCDQHPSIAHVARALDLSKVQMSRFLAGTSHPKPALLQRICDYFGVDGRVVLIPITEEYYSPNGHTPSNDRFGGQSTPAQEDAMSFLFGDGPIDSDPDFLPNGLYLFWRASFADRSKFICMPVRVFMHGQSKVCRGYDLKVLLDRGYLPPTHKREFRGAVLGQPQGVVIFFVHQGENRMHSVFYLDRADPSLGPDNFTGFSMACRGPSPSLRRMSRVLFQRLEGAEANPVSVARRVGLFSADEIPLHIFREISRPVED